MLRSLSPARVGALVALALTAACGDPTATASDVVRVEPSLSTEESPPPPPPIDTMAVGFDEGSSSSSVFALRVTYFLNQTGNNTWLAFHTTTAPTAGEQTASSSPEARIRFKGEKVWTNGSLIIGEQTIDLSKATVDVTRSTLGACSQRQLTDQSGGPACGTLHVTYMDAIRGERTLSFLVGYSPEEAAQLVNSYDRQIDGGLK